jgi:hypothetical protein
VLSSQHIQDLFLRQNRIEIRLRDRVKISNIYNNPTLYSWLAIFDNPSLYHKNWVSAQGMAVSP